MLHNPVMPKEIQEFFSQVEFQKPKLWDATFGRGGHTDFLLTQNAALTAYATDQDTEAIHYGKDQFKQAIAEGRLLLAKSNFSDIKNVITKNNWPSRFEFILMDLGVSSPQLDEAHRGFSFYHKGPLDMRMDRDTELTAEEIVNEWDEDDLVTVFQSLGEVKKPFRVVRAIVHDRKTNRFQSTTELAELIARVDGWRIKGKHPATQYFMGLRLMVNRELNVLQEILPVILRDHLESGGRIAVLTFHSLEDRIVKNIFKSNKDLGFPVNKKVVVASREEQKINIRSRSAKLRVFQRS